MNNLTQKTIDEAIKTKSLNIKKLIEELGWDRKRINYAIKHYLKTRCKHARKQGRKNS